MFPPVFLCVSLLCDRLLCSNVSHLCFALKSCAPLWSSLVVAYVSVSLTCLSALRVFDYSTFFVLLRFGIVSSSKLKVEALVLPVSPTLTYGHELWVITKRMGSRI